LRRGIAEILICPDGEIGPDSVATVKVSQCDVISIALVQQSTRQLGSEIVSSRVDQLRVSISDSKLGGRRVPVPSRVPIDSVRYPQDLAIDDGGTK